MGKNFTNLITSIISTVLGSKIKKESETIYSDPELQMLTKKAQDSLEEYKKYLQEHPDLKSKSSFSSKQLEDQEEWNKNILKGKSPFN